MKISKDNNRIIINWEQTPHNTNQLTILEEKDFVDLMVNGMNFHIKNVPLKLLGEYTYIDPNFCKHNFTNTYLKNNHF